uniref:Uncharacterized protein n=1 Tax=Candidatus Methanophaga sp. ANME-1 ERB7 TaxID=2759913 RepID=A0A7G9Z4N2_9EURY|nr:hypothetical protein MHJDHPNH_00018 [Methanosarcinales archaeon ANME-1 ERB7]
MIYQGDMFNANYQRANNVSNLRRLSYGMRYLVDKEEQYIEWLEKEKGEKFPEEVFKQELENTAKMEIEVSNILLRTYVERFGYEKCGDFKGFVNQYKKEREPYKIKYQKDQDPIPVLDINRDLRNHSIHSEPTYELIKSSKKPIQILSEQVMRLTNNLGEKEIVHDLDVHDLEDMGMKIDEARKKMTFTNSSNSSLMLYGELLREEVLECIRQIDLR